MAVSFKQAARYAVGLGLFVLLCCAVYVALILGVVIGLAAALGGL